ncbi:MAG: TrmB family transcriptional regulator [Candidatus Hodarchaeales archaeon]
MANKETIMALKYFGLSEYEARAYTTLVSIISGTATEISLAANIPRSKTYEILKKLAAKEFIEIISGKPLKFKILPPQEVFNKAKKEIIQALDLAESELKSIYEDQISKVPAPIWIINAPEKIIRKEIEIIQRANNAIFIFGGLSFKGEMEQLKRELEKAIKRGVTVKILTNPQCKIDGHIIHPSEQLKGLDCELKIAKSPIPVTKGLVRDDAEMLIVFCKIIDGNALSDTAIGIWSLYTEFTKIVKSVYNQIMTSNIFKA